MRTELLPYGAPTLDEEDVNEVVKILKSRWLTTGPMVAKFEKCLCEYVGCKHAVAVSSGTAALDIAVGSLGLPKGSEIVTTPFTFIATANSIIYNKCVPVFADICEDTFNIDPAQVRKKITKKTRAIIAVDFAGQPCDMDSLRDIANEHNLILISDAAHSLGAEYKHKKVGLMADITIFSFHPVKTITTGEGGALTTNDESLYKKLLMLRNHGIDRTSAERASSKSYEYDMKLLGRNYRLTDFQCALGISQLKKLDGFIKKRRRLATEYNNNLKNVKGIRTPYEKEFAKTAWHLYTILIESASAPSKITRDEFFRLMLSQNIGVNVHYIPVYKHSYYKQNFSINLSEFPITEKISNQIITLPLFPKMTSQDVNDVVAAAKKSLEQ